MKKIKKAAIKEVKKCSKNSKGVVKHIKETDSKEEIALVLLNNGYIEPFAVAFENENIIRFWRIWATYDYKRYLLTSKEANDLLGKLIKEPVRAEANTIESIDEEILLEIEKTGDLTADVLKKLDARKATHEKMLATIREISEKRLKKLETKFSELNRELEERKKYWDANS